MSVFGSEEKLLISWSPPWSPPGVILNYTVTFLATISNMKLNYHTAEIVLTVNGADLTRDGGFVGFCEQYLVKVIRVQQAMDRHQRKMFLLSTVSIDLTFALLLQIVTVNVTQ